MANERLNTIWEPRIGREATALLRQRSWLALTRLGLLAFIVVLAITVTGPLYYLVVLPVTGVYLFAYVWALMRINRRLADALSRHLGLPITPKNLPPVRRVEVFDRAVASLREGRPARDRSFFEGFIHIRTP
jgi:hypothetical protein